MRCAGERVRGDNWKKPDMDKRLWQLRQHGLDTSKESGEKEEVARDEKCRSFIWNCPPRITAAILHPIDSQMRSLPPPRITRHRQWRRFHRFLRSLFATGSVWRARDFEESRNSKNNLVSHVGPLWGLTAVASYRRLRKIVGVGGTVASVVR